jgi:iron complex transport system substrate-binding protein
VFKRTFAALLGAAFLAFAGAASPAQGIPHRIVSLSPTATEDLFAIGAGKQVVAVDSQSDYPKGAPRTKLAAFTPNAEAIIGYHPDLVVISYDPNGTVKALGKAHIRVLVQAAAKTFADVYAQIDQLGAVTGHAAGAKALVSRMRSRIAQLVRSAPKPARTVSVYHEISPDYYSATSKTFIGRVYALFDLRNIADGAGSSATDYPQLSGEYIVAQNPDLIVLSDINCCKQSAATVAARPGWGALDAVKRHSIVRIDDSIASRWGPRIVDFVKAIALALRTVPG